MAQHACAGTLGRGAHSYMKITFRYWKTTLLALILAGGCSKESANNAATGTDDDSPPVASKQMIAETDKMAEEVLQSSDILEAAEWLKKYPKSAVGEDEEGHQILLAPFVSRFLAAGAQRVVIQSAKLGQGDVLLAMVVVLPADPQARQKVFALEPQLSQLCQQTPVTDKGQKYLHYGFD
jgi:hypothetical protein